MLENQELRRPGGVPLGPGCLSTEPDLDRRRALLEPAAPLAAEGSGWPFCCMGALASAFCWLGLGDAGGICLGWEAGVDLGGEADLFSRSALRDSKVSNAAMRMNKVAGDAQMRRESSRGSVERV